MPPAETSRGQGAVMPDEPKGGDEAAAKVTIEIEFAAAP